MIERRFFSKVTLRAETAGSKTYLTGYAALFDNPSSDLGGFVEVIKKGAFSRALKEGQDVRHLVNHDPSLLLGRTKSGTLQLSEDSKGLRFRTLLPETGTADDLAALVARADIDECSFGFVPVEQAWMDQKAPDGSMQVIRELHDVDLVDISIVTFPAYPGTSAGVDGRALFPSGIPAEVRAHMGNSKHKRAADDQCACDCPECLDGDCSDCSNENCDDENCRAMVRAASNKMALRCTAHGIGADSDDRAARRRAIELAEAQW
jgi:HK97 family phage prohead protease